MLDNLIPLTVQVLQRAKELLQKSPCFRAFARDAEGSSVPETSPRACSWCLMGAVYAAGSSLGLDGRTTHLVTSTTARRLYLALPAHCVVEAASGLDVSIALSDFHDAQKSAEPSIELIDRTIASLQKEVQCAPKPK